ncbi:MAG TPA: sulfatase-like hydrolase/transferase [Planctomycetota bacterium]|nr:sulfatase-like hydrolase/transferase [Planctomycetota bacterium]
MAGFRRTLWLGLFLCSTAWCAQPNILFILSDDHRFDCIGNAGNRDIVTPNLDSLAKDGILFTHATVCTPLCSPSRASLLMGQLPHQHGYFSNKNWNREAKKGFRDPTAMELLVRSGYHTALIGKWHLDPEPWKVGFTEIRTWMPQGADEYINPKLARGNRDKVKEVRGHVTEIFTDDAVEFLEAHARASRSQELRAKSPFFLWLSYTAPHTPQKPVPEHIRELYKNLPPGNRPPGFPPGEKKTGPWAQYYGAISHLDEQVGRVLKALDESGLRENTVVIFLGDNGWLMGSHGRHGKIVPEDESIRVPLIVRAPAAFMSWTGKSPALVSSIDLSATWLELAGAPQPEDWPSRSFLPLLKDQRAPFRDDIYCEFEDEEDWEGNAYRLVRTHSFKYVLRPPRNEKELKSLHKKFKKMEEEKKDRKAPDLARERLFDLKSDPFELRDLSTAPEAQPALNAMRERLKAWMEKTNDPAAAWLAQEMDSTQSHEDSKTRRRRSD